MKIRFKLTMVCIISLLLVTVSTNLFAAANSVQQENITIKGTIKDSNSEPLIGVSVAVKGTSIGTITDFEGGYSMQIPNRNAVIVVSYIGFSTQEIKVENRTTINIMLKEDTKVLDEVVVVGYGVQKKVNLTGSVSSVDSKKLENRAVTNLSSALSGMAPGIRVTQGRGNPGDENVSIRFRGTSSFGDPTNANDTSNDPLVLVDGMVANMNVLNTEDIESITFLKDAASAAIYGSRAAAGVILVTTKKGKKEKTTVTITSMFAREKASTSLKFMSNMPDYMKYHNMAQANNTGTSSWYSEETIAAWEAANANPNGIYKDPTTGNEIPNRIAYPNTDWAQILFQPTNYHKHNASVSGGSENTNFLLSLGYQDNPGTLMNTGLQRYNIRANVETKIANFITFGTQTYATKEFKDPGSIEMKFLQQAYAGINPVYQGKYGASEDPNMTSVNNVLRSVAVTGGQREYTRINTSWYANIDIWKGLSFEAKFNYNEYNREDETYSKNLPSYRFRLGTDDSAIVENKPNIETAESYRYAYNSMSYTTNLLLRYNRTFGDHDVTAFAGQEQYYYKSSGFSATKRGLLDWDLTDINAAIEVAKIGGTDVQNAANAKTDYAMRSYFGRVNYAYKGKYLFEGNLRTDASSRFAPGYRSHVFPSFSLGWRLSEESFFAPVLPYVNSLKLRASYGSLGNTVSGNYDWQEKYAQEKYVFNQKISNGLYLSRLGNAYLTWESTATTGLGLDAAFFNQRLNLELDYYYRKTTDILTDPPTYLTLGTVKSAKSNSGEMENRGVDISLTWSDRIGKEFRYSVGFNMNYNSNKVTKFKGALVYGQDESLRDKDGNPTWRYLNLDDVSYMYNDTRRVEGHMLGEYYLRRPYSGSGTYTNADGSVNPTGGPKDGMIRTKADLDWARAMVAAGYSFNNKNIGTGSGQIWYGEILMADLNGDGKYGTDDDREFTGKSSDPKLVFGFNMSAEWKGFDLNAMWSGRLGSYHYIRERGANQNQISENTDALPANAADLFYRFDMEKSKNDPNYDPANDPTAYITAKYPRLYTGTGQMQNSTFYLYNTSYLKLKSLQIGYTLPKKWLTSAKIQKCRIFVAGENLLTIKAKDFPAVDPELGGSVTVYPIAKLYSCGINLTF